MGDGDELLIFERVRVLAVAAGAVRCLIGDKRVWLPREHIKGTLCRRGDCGRLLIRRWVAHDRHLAVPQAARAIEPGLPALRDRQPRRLHLLRHQGSPKTI